MTTRLEAETVKSVVFFLGSIEATVKSVDISRPAICGLSRGESWPKEAEKFLAFAARWGFDQRDLAEERERYQVPHLAFRKGPPRCVKTK
jgi:hypothetical protein